MFILGLLVILIVIYFIFSSNKSNTSPFNNANSGGQSFSSPIPSGYQIYAGHLPIAGIKYRKQDAIRFANSSNQELGLERELNNEHDPNAIKLIGISGSNKYFMGYIPKDLSEQIVSTGLFDSVKPRLARIYVGKNDFIDIQYQIIGPKTNKKQFDAFLENQPADSLQKDYFKFFGLTVPRNLTTGQAKQNISEHKKTLKPEEISEWEGLSNILLEFDDSDFKETYNLKKVSKSVLNEALNQLKQEGKTYSQLYDDIDEIVDRVIKLKPELEKPL